MTALAEASERHPMEELSAAIGQRVTRLGQMRSFDGELSKREFRDELYPLLGELIEFLGDLDNRFEALEEGGAIGIPADLAARLLQAILLGAQAADLACKFIPGAADGDGGGHLDQVRAAQTWFLENGPALSAEVKSITLTEGE